MAHPAPDPATADRTPDSRRLTRRRNVLLAQHHREQGWSIAQIAHLLDRAPATVRGYLHDPTGEKAKRRKACYAGSVRALRRADLRRRRQAPRVAPLPALQAAIAARAGRASSSAARTASGTSASASSPPRSTGRARTPAAAAGRARALPLRALAVAVGHPPALRDARGGARRRLPAPGRTTPSAGRPRTAREQSRPAPTDTCGAARAHANRHPARRPARAAPARTGDAAVTWAPPSPPARGSPAHRRARDRAVLLLAGAASLIPALLTDPTARARSDARVRRRPRHPRRLPGPLPAGRRRLRASRGRCSPRSARSSPTTAAPPRPGVRSGVNAFGCCAGPMQFNLRNGPPSTWQSYRVDGDDDGDTDPYDPADAIASAGHYLHALLDARAAATSPRAVYGYNHSQRLRRRRPRARPRVRDEPDAAADRAAPALPAATGPTGHRPGQPAARRARAIAARVRACCPPGRWPAAAPPSRSTPACSTNALWLLRTYHLRVTAAREAGHNTHGDGTALDLVPAEPVDQAAWDASAGALARDLGWTPACGALRQPTRLPARPRDPVRRLRRLPRPRLAADLQRPCPAHLHISWVSPCYGTSAPSPPCTWVTAVPISAGEEPSDTRSSDIGALSPSPA